MYKYCYLLKYLQYKNTLKHDIMKNTLLFDTKVKIKECNFAFMYITFHSSLSFYLHHQLFLSPKHQFHNYCYDI